MTAQYRPGRMGRTIKQKRPNMKKITLFFFLLILGVTFLPADGYSKPFWVRFKIGIFAKWSITTTGSCGDGWGICLTTNTEGNQAQTFLGYDKETDKFYIRISEKDQSSKHFNGNTFDLKADSPVDPKLIAGFPNFQAGDKIVVLKKGIYKVLKDGPDLITAFDYYLQ
jgi:hypothetical protein